MYCLYHLFLQSKPHRWWHHACEEGYCSELARYPTRWCWPFILGPLNWSFSPTRQQRSLVQLSNPSESAAFCANLRSNHSKIMAIIIFNKWPPPHPILKSWRHMSSRPQPRPANSLNWKISKCWNLQFEDYNLNWEILNSPSLQFWTQLYQLHPDVNSLTMIQHKKNIKKGMLRAAFFASDRKETNFSGWHQAYHLVQASSSAWFE